MKNFSIFDSWSVRQISRSLTRFHTYILEKPPERFSRYGWMVEVIGSHNQPIKPYLFPNPPVIRLTGIWDSLPHVKNLLDSLEPYEIDQLAQYCKLRLPLRGRQYEQRN